jgi:hypothetical protein
LQRVNCYALSDARFFIGVGPQAGTPTPALFESLRGKKCRAFF